MLDSREPPQGDFVAYVEKIEREQLARAMQPHQLPQVSASGKVVANESRPLSTAEAQRVLQVLKAHGKTGAAAPVGAMIGVVLGAGLIAFGLLAEGGIFLVLLGAALLWHNLRKLRGTGSPPMALPAQQVDAIFGQKATNAARNRKA